MSKINALALCRCYFFALLVGCGGSSSGSDSGSYVLAPVFSGLNKPVYLAAANDGSSRLFVVEKGGFVRVATGGVLAPSPFLDISAKVSKGGEQGLLSIAFSPNFGSDRFFYTNYTDTAGTTVVSRWRASAGNPNAADPESEQVLLRIPQPFENHNAGGLQFGPDGLLYIATGDGGSLGDPLGIGQDIMSLLGKVLRIDVSSEEYRIPSDNPYVGRSDARPEIWAVGFRNPWRFSFDAGSGRLFVADVGQSRFEEVNLIERGKNYGWSVMEGKECFQDGCSKDDLELPIALYGHDEGSSITGGYVYRGSSLPELEGKYVFGDFGSGTIFVLTERGGEWEREVLLSSAAAISSFGEDEAKDLYVVDFAGAVFKLQKQEGAA